jgi:predicted DNA-binding protein
MNMARKIFPSQRRYMDENPAITFRMKREEKERIVQMAELAGKSVSELVRVALLGLEEDFSEAYEKVRNEGYKKGFMDAKKTYRLWNYCNICGGVIDLLPNSNEHKAIIDYLKKERWGHPKCHKKVDNTQL